jgi:hypothetical protein
MPLFTCFPAFQGLVTPVATGVKKNNGYAARISYTIEVIISHQIFKETIQPQWRMNASLFSFNDFQLNKMLI